MEDLPKSPFPPSLAFFLDNPIRRLFINRAKYLRGIGVKEGDHVLEVGCGPGFFTTILSDIVGEQGKVYAQDVEERMIERVKGKVETLMHKNVEILLCNSSALKLLDSSCDIAFCSNVFEEIYKEGELEGTVKEIDRVLKPEGVVIVKEHRFGGTRDIIRETEALFIGMGYKKVFDKETLLSYNSKLIKP